MHKVLAVDAGHRSKFISSRSVRKCGYKKFLKIHDGKLQTVFKFYYNNRITLNPKIRYNTSGCKDFQKKIFISFYSLL